MTGSGYIVHDVPDVRRAYGSGSLLERGGSYYAKFRVDGEQVLRVLGPIRTRESREGLTRPQAEAALRAKIAEVRSAPARKAKPRTIADVGAAYVTYAREHKGLKATTLGDYEGIIRVHLEAYFRTLPVEKIDAKRIERFALHLRTTEGQGHRGRDRLAPKTIANVLSTLTVLLNFAVRKKWIAVSPMASVDLPRLEDVTKPIDELSFLEVDEVARLIAAAKPGRYEALDRALYAMAAYTGMRQGELRALKWEQVDFDRALVHVLEGVTRGHTSSPKGKRRRTVPLAPTAAEALVGLRAVGKWTKPEDYVFAAPATGRPMARTRMMERYRDALETAKLPRSFGFHDLRHTFGTSMARAGIPAGTIQAWMGHADLATTERYMHYAPRGADARLIESALAAPIG